MTESSPRDEELFEEALARPESERRAFLTNACADDGELLQRVEDLVRAHEAAGHFLGTSHLDAVQAHVRNKIEVSAALEDIPGDWVGRYKLLEKIGEGGCGVVYMAGQDEPVRRRVAVKVIKVGMDTKAVVGRFEAERQALAMMDHPNIAKVFDAGATDTGRPFFAMELVLGVPITTYCDEQNLPTCARLELFMQVCYAVQHAHQKGIIHRDLKPSNILVTHHDAVSVPKVIDFGIAKATQGRLTDSTIFTAFEQFIGTPAYMSPEQADISGLDIDTRSDVYSLGVLLYELLTGCQPFEPTTLLSASLHELRRMIREEEPPRPSTRLVALGGLSRETISRKRSLPPAQLAALLRGDLDWIVMRAIEKDRARRYASARDLALDIQRHLGSEPVWARPPTTLYRVGKYARRHRTGFVSLIAVFVALVGGLAVALAGLERAIAAQRTAENALAEAEAVTEFLTNTVGAADPERSGREVPLRVGYLDAQTNAVIHPAHLARDVLVRDVLGKASREITVQFAHRPLLQARLHEAIGETYRGLGVFDAASEHLKSAVELRTRELGRHHPDTLRACGKLAWVHVMTSEIGQAIPLATEAIDAYQRLPHPDKQDLANAYFALSFAEFVHAGMQERSLEDSERSVALFTEALGPEHSLTISARVESTVRLWSTERFDEGLANCHRLIKETESMGDHPARGQLLHMAALITEELGDYAASAEFARQCDEMRTRIFGEGHYETHNARFFQAFALAYLEDPTEHVRVAEKILQLQEKLVVKGSPNRPMVMSRTALLLGLVGRSQEAVAMAREAMDSLRVFFGGAPFAFRASADLAMLESQAGNYDQAEQRSRALLDALGRAPRRYEYSYSRARIALATALIGQKQFDEANKILLENQSILAGLRMNMSLQLTLTQRAMAQLQQARGRQQQSIADTR